MHGVKFELPAHLIHEIDMKMGYNLPEPLNRRRKVEEIRFFRQTDRKLQILVNLFCIQDACPAR
jgi:hypothetical protein